jgi:hypothetical protein
MMPMRVKALLVLFRPPRRSARLAQAFSDAMSMTKR